jgi:hypothetical protein
VAVEVRDVADGLWLWRHAHPDWSAGADWEPEVSSFAVASRGARVLLDPLAPPALRTSLDLPFEFVLVSHGAPVHTREDFVAALDRDPWSTWTGA